MPEPAHHERVPDPVPTPPLPEFEYDELTKRDRIGSGGDADVYRATVEHSGETYTVAVKEPRFDGTIQRRVVESFQSEAETWESVDDHEHIVSMYAWGAEPLPWLGLEFMDAGTLDDNLGTIDVDQALWIGGRVAEGVRYGHRHGVAHLDIKPTNVLLQETDAETWNYPKVSDWGLSKLLLEHSNSVDGISPSYAAPEQFDPETYGRPDDITDIYQLGTLVYALLTGEPLFTGASTAVMRAVLDEDPIPPSEQDPSIPPSVDDVVLKAIEKDRDDRYQGLLPFRNALDRLFERVAFEGTETGTDTGKQEDPVAATVSAEPRDRTQSKTGGQNSRLPDASPGRDDTTKPADTVPQGTDSAEPSFPTRRQTLAVLGVSVVGGSGVLVTQLGSEETVAPPAPPVSEFAADYEAVQRSMGPSALTAC